VVQDEVGDDAQTALVRLVQEVLDVVHRPVRRVHAVIIGDVVAVVAERGGIEREEPDAVDAEVLHVIQSADQAAEITHAVVVGILERLDVQLVEDGVLVPERSDSHSHAGSSVNG
jgi:hypothetical protein